MLGGIAIMTLAGATAASAQQTCFTAFGRSIHYQFASSVPASEAAGIRNVVGVTFGALAPCAGLTHWPDVGPLLEHQHVDPGSLCASVFVGYPGCAAA